MSRVVEMARLMQGNEAVAEGAIAAGVHFFAGYPITPSTEVAEIMSTRLPRLGGKFIQMEDEISSMAAVIGASLTGARALTATSGPGFSLMQENIGFASMAEVPCVIVNVQRSGPSTGMPTAPAQGDVMQARWGTHGDHPVVVLCPSLVREAYDLAARAVNMAEKYRVPVVLLLDEVIGHLREKVVLPKQDEIEIYSRRRPESTREDYAPYRAGAGGVPPMANFGDGYRYHVTGLVHDEDGKPTVTAPVAGQLLERLHSKLYDNLDDIILEDSRYLEDAEIVVVSYGATARSARRAVKEARKKGVKAGMYRPLTLWPFPEQRLAGLAGQAHTFIVAEMNMGQYRGEVERAVKDRSRVLGIHRANGELITPEEITGTVLEVV